MDVARTGETASAALLREGGAERTERLAEARERAGAARLQSAQSAEVRQAENFAKAREVIERALGAHTKVTITRADSEPIFLYRAVDTTSGEVVQEWPHHKFVEFLNTVEPGAGDRLAGLVIDRQA